MSEQILAVVIEIVRQNVLDNENDDLGFIISSEMPLFGEGAVIDSLTLVNVIVDIEDALLSKFNKAVCLTDDDAVFREPSPFTSVKTLVDYIAELLVDL